MKGGSAGKQQQCNRRKHPHITNRNRPPRRCVWGHDYRDSRQWVVEDEEGEEGAYKAAAGPVEVRCVCATEIAERRQGVMGDTGGAVAKKQEQSAP